MAVEVMAVIEGIQPGRAALAGGQTHVLIAYHRMLCTRPASMLGSRGLREGALTNASEIRHEDDDEHDHRHVKASQEPHVPDRQCVGIAKPKTSSPQGVPPVRHAPSNTIGCSPQRPRELA